MRSRESVFRFTKMRKPAPDCDPIVSSNLKITLIGDGGTVGQTFAVTDHDCRDSDHRPALYLSTATTLIGRPTAKIFNVRICALCCSLGHSACPHTQTPSHGLPGSIERASGRFPAIRTQDAVLAIMPSPIQLRIGGQKALPNGPARIE